MLGPTHKVAGICTGVVTAVYLLPSPYSLSELVCGGCLIAGSVVGSFLPDIDHRGSTINTPVKALTRRRHPAKSASKKHRKLFGHRGITHTLIFAVAVPAILSVATLLMPPSFRVAYLFSLAGLSVGMLSHLVLDGLTPQGVPLFAPWNLKKYHIVGFRSRSREQLTVLTCITLAALLVANHWM